MSSSQNDVNAPLLGQNGENPPTYNSTERTGHSSSMGGTVTLRTPSPLPRSESMTERGRARTVSSIAPMPESCYTISMFLFFLICFQLMNLMTLTYTDSVLNYISKRFRISNTMASFIPSSYQIGNIVVIIPVSFFGHKFDRPRVIAIGVLMMVIGLGCCTLPHFLLLPPPYRNASDTEVCHRYYPFLNNSKQWFASDDTSVSNYQGDAMASTADLEDNPATYTALLFLGHALIGCGSAPISPLGFSYLDDHVVIRKMPVYLGIFIGTTLLGPVSGFLLGSLTSSIYVELNNPYHMQPTNPAWIGAWWLGYAIAGLLILLLLFPFLFYPSRLPVSSQKQAELAKREILMEREQMIERWWRELHEKVEKFYKKQLLFLHENGHYDSHCVLHRKILAFVFIPVLERAMGSFVERWNAHRIRKQKGTILPSGIPDDIYAHPEKYNLEKCGWTVSEGQLAEVAHLAGVHQAPNDYLSTEDRGKFEAIINPAAVEPADCARAFLFVKHKLAEAEPSE